VLKKVLFSSIFKLDRPRIRQSELSRAKNFLTNQNQPDNPQSHSAMAIALCKIICHDLMMDQHAAHLGALMLKKNLIVSKAKNKHFLTNQPHHQQSH
jgi:hypothetical protein